MERAAQRAGERLSSADREGQDDHHDGDRHCYAVNNPSICTNRHISDSNSTMSSQDSQRDQQVALIRHETQAIPRLAETQIQDATRTESQLTRIIEESDDVDASDDAEAALRFVQQRRAVWEQLWANSLVTAQEVQTLAQVDVTVVDVLLDGTSTNQVRVPKEVLEKIARANIKTGNVTAGDGSTNRVGMF